MGTGAASGWHDGVGSEDASFRPLPSPEAGGRHEHPCPCAARQRGPRARPKLLTGASVLALEPSGVDGDVHASAHTLSSGKRERGFQLDTDDPKGHPLALPVPSHPAGRARGSTGPGGLEGWSKDRGLPRDWGAAKPPGGRRTQPVLGRERQVSGRGPWSWCLHPWAPRANKGFGLPACAPTPGSLISHLGCGGAVCRRLVSEAVTVLDAAFTRRSLRPGAQPRSSPDVPGSTALPRNPGARTRRASLPLVLRRAASGPGLSGGRAGPRLGTACPSGSHHWPLPLGRPLSVSTAGSCRGLTHVQNRTSSRSASRLRME